MARRIRSPWWVLVVVVVLGGILGSVIAEALVGYPLVSFLSRDIRFGVDPPFTLSLPILSFTIGATIRLNLAILVGIVIAIWVLRMMR